MQNKNKYITFSNNEFGKIRIMGDKNNPIFCLSDVCKILELQNPINLKNAIDREFDKGGIFNIYPLNTKGGIQNFTFINEAELYFILMRSDKPNAKPFRQWVVNEVLPNIRKKGFYKIQKEQENSIELGDEYKQYLENIKATRIETQKAMKLSKDIENLEKKLQSKYLAFQKSMTNLNSLTNKTMQNNNQGVVCEANPQQNTHFTKEDKNNVKTNIIQDLLNKCKNTFK